jgi:excinuclease ABC subunit B
MYADTVTESMRRAIDETNRRRKTQTEYNEQHGIEPRSIVKAIKDLTDQVRAVAEEKAEYVVAADMPKDELARVIEQLDRQMKEAAAELEFERAAALRDQVFELRQSLQDEDVPEWERMRMANRERRLKQG